MTGAQLQAWVEQNKTALGAAGAAAVAGLALYRRKNPTSAKKEAAPTAAAGAQLAGVSAGSQPYDSTASDLYGALQPQLGSLGQQLTDLLNQQASSAVVPVPAAPTPIVADPVSTIPYSGTGNLVPMATVTSRTFNGLPNFSFGPGTSLQDAAAATGHGGAPVWNPGPDGLFHNQWGNTASGLDQYGSPIN